MRSDLLFFSLYELFIVVQGVSRAVGTLITSGRSFSHRVGVDSSLSVLTHVVPITATTPL